MQSNEKVKIAAFFANPLDSEQLVGLKEEEREIREKVNAQRNFSLSTVTGTRLRDLLSLLDHETDPIHIFHYSGHANDEGIWLESDQDSEPDIINWSALAKELRHQKNLRCIVLNGCESFNDTFLNDLGTPHPHIIVMSAPIGTRKASIFAVRFYETLAKGASFEVAFDKACNALRLKKYNEDADIPKMILAFGQDKDEAILAEVSSQDPAKGLFNKLPTDRVSSHVNPPDLPYPAKSHMPFERNHDFVGRDAELQAIAESMKSERGAVVAAGMGGVGKTQLAVEWVQRYGRFFAGGVFWLDFSDPASIPLSIATAGAKYGIVGYDSLSLEEQAATTRTQWRTETPTLLIFDNCEEPQLLQEYNPIGSGARILLTSRDQTWQQQLQGQGICQVQIDTLPRRDSIALLQRLRNDLSENDANVIAEELGDLPLALHIAGSFLQQYRATSYGDPITYLERLRATNPVTELSRQGSRIPDLPTRHERDVARTFLISIDRLKEDTHPDSVLSLGLLALIACFAPSVDIPSAWLSLELSKTYDELDMADALSRLLSVGLIDAPQEGMVRMHRLVAHVVLALVEGETDAVSQSENIILTIKPEYGQPDFVAQMDGWLGHAQYLGINALTRHDEHAALLASELGYRLYHLALHKGALAWMERALAINREVLGARHPVTAASLNNLAELYRVQGQYEAALPLYEEGLAIKREVLGTRHPTTARSLNNLAVLYKTQGQYEVALPLFEEGLAIRREVLGTRHPATAISLINLAGLYEVQGQYEVALPLYEEGLAINRQVLGSRHPDTATSLTNLAGLYYAQGQYEAGLPLFQEALLIYQEVLGTRHPHTATSLNNLAELYRAQGDYEAALPLYEEGLAIKRDVLGTRHPDTATSLNNLAGLYLAQRDYEAALPLYEEGLAIRREMLGARHPHTATSLSNLAELYRVQGMYEVALPLYKESLAIRQEVLGVHHPDTATSLNNLGLLYYDQGQYEIALPLYEEAVSILIEKLGMNHPNTKSGIANRARCLAAMNSKK